MAGGCRQTAAVRGLRPWRNEGRVWCVGCAGVQTGGHSGPGGRFGWVARIKHDPDTIIGA